MFFLFVFLAGLLGLNVQTLKYYNVIMYIISI